METRLLRLLSMFTGFLIECNQASSWTIKVPTVVNATEGTCVDVPCHTQPHRRVIWYLYHSLHYPKVYDRERPGEVDTRFRGRTAVMGDAANGNCTLRIKDVRPSDNNLRLYVWINPESTTTQTFHNQLATIAVVRRVPRLSMPKHIMEGDIFQANCSISLSCPSSPPSLQWAIHPKNTNFKIIKNDLMWVHNHWLYTEMLQGKATYLLLNSTVTCTAHFKTYTTESLPTRVNIIYKPLNVTMQALQGSSQVLQGHSVTVSCTANSNPQPYIYSWLRRENGLCSTINSSEGEMTFDNITKHTDLSCMAYNIIGVGQSPWLHLELQYAPVILSESACHVMGEVMTCVCQVEAQPNARIYWNINGNYTLPSTFTTAATNKGNETNVEINGPAPQQHNVSCIATNSVGSDIKQMSLLYLANTSLQGILTSLLIGSLFLLGCVVFYKQYHRDRLQTITEFKQRDEVYDGIQSLTDTQDDQLYNNSQRLQSQEGAYEHDTIYEIQEDRRAAIYEVSIDETII